MKALMPMLISMLASKKSMETIVDDAIEALQQFKKDGYDEEKDMPLFKAATVLLMKLQQQGMSKDEIRKRSVETAATIEAVEQIREEREGMDLDGFTDIPEDELPEEMKEILDLLRKKHPGAEVLVKTNIEEKEFPFPMGEMGEA